MTAPSDDKFSLAGCGADFGSRAKNIFAGLESLEARHIAHENTDTARRESQALMKPDPADEFFANSSSSASDSTKFEIPSRPPPKRIHGPSRPGYETCPSKWKRYDLSDIPASQLSERSNQEAAQSFLDSLQVQRHEETDSILDMEQDSMRHVFRKPAKKPVVSTDDPKDGASLHHHAVEDQEDIDGAEDTARTQVLSFAEDEATADGKQTRSGGKVQFRHRGGKRSVDRQVRSHDVDDDDDDGSGEKVGDEVLAGGETSALVEKSHEAIDSDSDSDSFSELPVVDSDSDQEELSSSDNKIHPSDVDKDASEDAGLD